MSTTPPDRRRALENIRQQVELLRSSGVEFVPAPVSKRQAPAAPSAMNASKASQPSEPTPTTGSLFAPAADEAPPIDQRLRELTVLQDEVRRCMACTELCSTRTQTVFGVGPLDVEICFLGEAPGADEDRQGEPFVGAAGQLLTKIIESMGLQRKDVYICNILKCRPPGNRPPRPDEAANCRPFLDRQLALVRPRVICCLGATASQSLLRMRTPIGQMRGRFYDYNGIPVLCTYHPASLLPSRTPQNKALVWEDMKMLLQHIGRPIPAVKKPQ